MTHTSRRDLLKTLASAAALVATASASAQSGTGPAIIKVVVPFVAGGITDQVARGILDRVSKSLAQTMVIENRPGAGSRIGSEAVMRADPDGTTLLFTNPSYSILPVTDPAVKYDPAKALAPVALAGTYGLPVVVSARLPVNTLGEFIAHARKNPGQLSYGSAGRGSGAHFAGEFFQRLTGTEMVHVPYKSTSAALIDVAGGVMDLTFDATAKAYADAGKVKIVAVTGSHRDPRLPNVPTAAEGGLQDFVLGSWLGLFAPVGTPAPVMDRLN
ncbi:Bug family tripartite tricarboxylate transporter substrate binding protein [Hydrogenophaga flava]|uniref:Bug family tripartite tricarboxylate transporter substrate binding protein n=1 Tax=Hydrogenophaga flava TaxID=65657 RepID=UPI0008250569|nr:tripartite tricarboxylate transporter substrate-binding protein [Hydrogenophaga flava]